jgi:hypothetical protein
MSSTPPPQDSTNEAALLKEIERAHARFIEAVKDYGYYKNEAVLATPVDQNGNVLSVTLTYVCRDDSELERRITNELAGRIETTIHEWTMWAEALFQPDTQTPF